MHAYIIAGGTKEDRLRWITKKLNEWDTSSSDQIRIVGGVRATGIADIRRLGKHLALRPMNSVHSAGIIEDADALTIEAQQALLKTLEEPPAYVFIICEVSNPEMLLPTIQSRCLTIQLKEPDEDFPQLAGDFQNLKTLFGRSVGEKLREVDDHITSPEVAKAWIDHAILALRSALLMGYKKNSTDRTGTLVLTTRLRMALRAKAELASNITPKTAIDRFLILLQ